MFDVYSAVAVQHEEHVTAVATAVNEKLFTCFVLFLKLLRAKMRTQDRERERGKGREREE